MGQRSRGGALLNVQIRTLILSCVALLSLASSSSAAAISIEPVVHTVISITQVDKSKTTETKSQQKGVRSAEASQSVPSSDVPAATDIVPLEQSPVVGEPLPELPVVDAVPSYPTSVSLARPVSTVVVSHPIVGNVPNDSVAPLQATHQGWKIFGIVWYWWLLGGFTAYYTIQFMRSRQRQQDLADGPVVI